MTRRDTANPGPGKSRRILGISVLVAAGAGAVMAVVTAVAGPTPGAWVFVIGMAIAAGYTTAVMLQLHSLARLNSTEPPQRPLRWMSRRQLVTRTGLLTLGAAATCGGQIWWLSVSASRDTVPLAALTGSFALAGPIVLIYELRRRKREHRLSPGN